MRCRLYVCCAERRSRVEDILQPLVTLVPKCLDDDASVSTKDETLGKPPI